ncbi:hypothetical protein [Frankia umida]|uniref:hypothetical protein n=1 Tax=Frankia umida TaxID=573489 RepID=UPI00200FC7F5|nr:hypothetical protein [Frankia umida]
MERPVPARSRSGQAPSPTAEQGLPRSAQGIMELQRTIGNAAVTRLITAQRRMAAPSNTAKSRQRHTRY